MFLFSPCQVGAEAVFKKEVKRLFPDWRAAFARPGFVSFKVETGTNKEAGANKESGAIALDSLLEQSVFARTAACSLGKIETESKERLVEETWKIITEHHLFINRVHVFRRDPSAPGERDFEPGLTPDLIERHHNIVQHSPTPRFLGVGAADPNQPGLSGETVLDLVETDPGKFMLGFHSVSEELPIHARYPGGVLPIALPTDAVSRAWLKFEEGLRWANIFIAKRTRCLDIGAAPGGGSQVLLSHGAEVIGIDPGAVDPAVLKHPNFKHVRSKVRETKWSTFQDVHWIIADMNVAPNYTLDVLEEIVKRKETHIQGLLFTLKLIEWSLADELSRYAERIRQLGFGNVRVKQLTFNRQEVMVAAR
jgi:23S rRNA (cytidine2498-2'-O)-methyltransferase